jgi:hypothetical protein
MSGKFKRDYVDRHRKIRDKLIEQSRTRTYACFNVAQLASELRMDIRTVRAHLNIMQLDAVGVFTDDREKQFCTKEGVALLANTLEAHEKYTE